LTVDELEQLHYQKPGGIILIATSVGLVPCAGGVGGAPTENRLCTTADSIKQLITKFKSLSQ